MKKLISTLLLATMVFTLGACTKPAEDSKTPGVDKPITDNPIAEDKDDNKIILGTSADFAPYEFHKMIDGKDTILGADIALAQQIAKDLGKELVIEDMSFDFLLSKLKDGSIDFVIASMNVTEKRLEQADFSSKYHQSRHVVLIKEENATTLNSVEAFKGKTLAAQAGSVQAEHLTTYFSESEHTIVKKVPDEVTQLKAGKVDGVVLELEVAEQYANAHDDLVVADFVVEEATGSAIAVKKGNKELLDAINKTLESVEKEGSYAKWITEASEQNQ